MNPPAPHDSRGNHPAARRAAPRGQRGARRGELEVINTGDRPIQVGSHYHFYEANRGAAVRPGGGRAASGSTLPAGTAVRFEAGDTKRGRTGRACRRPRGPRAQRPGHGTGRPVSHASTSPAASTPRCSGRPRATACASADTELLVEVERDLIAEGGGYGNEVKFGGGKVIRDGMGQSPTARDAESPGHWCSPTR